MSLCGRLSGLAAWTIWTTLVACALAPRPQTAAVPPAITVPPAQAAPVRNYVHPEGLRSDVVWPDLQVALRWQLAPTARDLPPAEYDHPFDGEVEVFDELDTEALPTKCSPASNLCPGERALACTSVSKARTQKRCVIYIGERRKLALQGSSFENILRYEIGHRNGWPGDHKDARTWNEAEREKEAQRTLPRRGTPAA